jgi:hypothetical protein
MKYIGRAEDLLKTDRGVEFTIVIENENGEEVFRRRQWVSTGIQDATHAKQHIKNVVKRLTEDMYSHIEGAKEIMDDPVIKKEIEDYRAEVDTFVPKENRAMRSGKEETA